MNTLFVYNPYNFRISPEKAKEYRDFYENCGFRVCQAIVGDLEYDRKAVQFFKEHKPISLKYSIVGDSGFNCYAEFSVEVKPENYQELCLVGDVAIGDLKRKILFDGLNGAPTDYEILMLIISWMSCVGCIKIGNTMMDLNYLAKM